MTPQDERERYAKLHFIQFGHWPEPDLTQGGRCGHPSHMLMRVQMENIAAGDNLVIPFEWQQQVADDDPNSNRARYEESYDKEVTGWKERIRGIEEKERWEKEGKSQF